MYVYNGYSYPDNAKVIDENCEHEAFENVTCEHCDGKICEKCGGCFLGKVEEDK